MLDIKGLLKNAYECGASDVHLCVGATPRMRIHGKLSKTNYPVLNPSDTLEILLWLLSPEQRNDFERDSSIDFAAQVDSVGRFRVNAYKQRGCISLSIRIVDSEIPDIEYLQVPKPLIDVIDKGRGLVLICGEARSGKSALIASLLNHINKNYEKNIITIEDPIEYVHTHDLSLINQREIGLDTADYYKGIQDALKEDPDVIFVKSFKDSSVIDACMDYATMNRLVISSLNVCGSIACIKKIATYYNTEGRRALLSNLADSLSAIVSRKLCTSSSGEMVPAYEVCIINKEMRGFIREGRLNELINCINKNDSCILMDDYLKHLVEEGYIEDAEAILHYLYV